LLIDGITTLHTLHTLHTIHILREIEYNGKGTPLVFCKNKRKLIKKVWRVVEGCGGWL